MRRFLTVPFTTKRTPAMTAGKQGTPQPYLVDAALRCTPLDPADPGRRGERDQRIILESPTTIRETFVSAALDIREGDMLEADGFAYHVRAIGVWRWRSGRFLALLLEEAAPLAPSALGILPGMRLGAVALPPTYTRGSHHAG